MDKIKRIEKEINNYIEWMKQQEFEGRVGNSIYVKGYLDGLDDVLRSISDIKNEVELVNWEVLK